LFYRLKLHLKPTKCVGGAYHKKSPLIWKAYLWNLKVTFLRNWFFILDIAGVFILCSKFIVSDWWNILNSWILGLMFSWLVDILRKSVDIDISYYFECQFSIIKQPHRWCNGYSVVYRGFKPRVVQIKTMKLQGTSCVLRTGKWPQQQWLSKVITVFNNTFSGLSYIIHLGIKLWKL
jgi:hypothetical protein